jgi:hypothetical protein
VDPVYGEQHQATFGASMEAGRQLHEEGHAMKDQQKPKPKPKPKHKHKYTHKSCQHGKRKGRCKDCGTGYCGAHGRLMCQCKDCAARSGLAEPHEAACPLPVRGGFTVRAHEVADLRVRSSA